MPPGFPGTKQASTTAGAGARYVVAAPREDAGARVPTAEGRPRAQVYYVDYS